jgi:hypothetical protein|tara:strand:+ start:1530 stop:1907 length:378 start_codon:yes stop_codon:yes gene_type:complete
MTDPGPKEQLQTIGNLIKQRLDVNNNDYTETVNIALLSPFTKWVRTVEMEHRQETLLADLHLLREGGPEMALIKPQASSIAFALPLLTDLDEKLSTIPIGYGRLTTSGLTLHVLPEYKDELKIKL